MKETIAWDGTAKKILIDGVKPETATEPAITLDAAAAVFKDVWREKRRCTMKPARKLQILKMLLQKKERQLQPRLAIII